MRFQHSEVNFEVRYEGQQNCSKTHFINFLKVFSDHHMWGQNWPHYVWTSLCQVNFFMNLIHSQSVLFFDIWYKAGVGAWWRVGDGEGWSGIYSLNIFTDIFTEWAFNQDMGQGCGMREACGMWQGWGIGQECILSKYIHWMSLGARMEYGAGVVAWGRSVYSVNIFTEWALDQGAWSREGVWGRGGGMGQECIFSEYIHWLILTFYIWLLT